MAESSEHAPTPTRPAKSAAAFRTISEVADELNLQQHVLRFWETKFPNVRPLKRGGGRRYYRPEDVELLRRIRDLLYEDGYTIKGVQKMLRQNGGKMAVAAVGNSESGKSPTTERRAHGEIEAVIEDLEDLKGMLRDAVG